MSHPKINQDRKFQKSTTLITNLGHVKQNLLKESNLHTKNQMTNRKLQKNINPQLFLYSHTY